MFRGFGFTNAYPRSKYYATKHVSSSSMDTTFVCILWAFAIRGSGAQTTKHILATKERPSAPKEVAHFGLVFAIWGFALLGG